MPAYTGSALILTWVSATPSGTVALATDYQTFTYTPAIDLIETTAGADAAKEYIIGMKDATMAFTGIHQAGGTADIAKLVEGVQGTLTCSPEGTATGKVKMIIPAMSQGITWNLAYNDKVIWNISWVQTAARTDTVW